MPHLESKRGGPGKRKTASTRTTGAPQANYPGRVRIIAGKWRGRWLPVPHQPDLRPTGNRLRQSLFDWLTPIITGADCLDLFAGTGALGFEAASRGANMVVMMDRDRRIVEGLRETAEHLSASNVRIEAADALQWLEGKAAAVDIVFLDPPFQLNLLDRCCDRLVQGEWLKAGAWIYLESDRRAESPRLPANWRLRREKITGDVRGLLVQAP